MMQNLKAETETETEMVNRVGGEFLGQGRFAMVLTDPHQPDNPITYVNRAFEKMTGYSREAAVGRNCRFLQGDDLDQPGLSVLREGIARKRVTSVELRNYSATGEMFVNRLLVAPIEDNTGALLAYVGIQTAIEPRNSSAMNAVAQQDTIDHLELLLKEANQRVKTHLGLLAALIRDSKPDPSAIAAELLSHRVEALSLLYDDLSPNLRSANQPETVSAGEYVSKVAATLSTIDPTQGVRFNVETDYCLMGVDRAALLGLIVSETISVMLTHMGDAEGPHLIGVGLREVAGNQVELEIGANYRIGEGFELEDSSRAIIEGLAAQMGGKLSLAQTEKGSALRLDFGAIH